MDVDAREMEKDHRAHETVVSSAVETIFRGIAYHATPSKGSGKKGKQSKSRPKSAGKGKREMDKSRGKSKGSKSAKCSHRGESSKTGLSGLENRIESKNTGHATSGSH